MDSSHASFHNASSILMLQGLFHIFIWVYEGQRLNSPDLRTLDLLADKQREAANIERRSKYKRLLPFHVDSIFFPPAVESLTRSNVHCLTLKPVGNCGSFLWSLFSSELERKRHPSADGECPRGKGSYALILRRLQSAKDQPVWTDGQTSTQLRQVCRRTVGEGRPGDARLQHLSGAGHCQFYARIWCRGVTLR